MTPPFFDPLSPIRNARGCIEGPNDRGRSLVNGGGKINGARFEHYDPDTDTVTIRVDHSGIPAFWLELPFTKAALHKWVEAEKRER